MREESTEEKILAAAKKVFLFQRNDGRAASGTPRFSKACSKN